MQSKFEHALIHYKNGQLNKAKDICIEILKIDSGNFDALYLLAVIALQFKNYLKSAEIISKAIKIKPNHFEAYNIQAIALVHLKQLESAIESWSQAIKIRPDYADAYYNCGNAFLELKKIDSALENFNKAIKVKPDYFQAYINRGNVLLKLKEIDSALASYDKAIKINPNYAEAYYNRGKALKESYNLEEAINSYNQAIKINPNYAEAYYNRGNALSEFHNLEEAINSYNQAIKINPNYAEAYNNRGNALIKLKQTKLAVKSYEEAIKIKPDLEFLLGSILHTKQSMCNWESYEKDLKILIQKIIDGHKVSPPFYTLSFFDSLKLQRISAEKWVKDKFPLKNIFAPITKRKKEKKIRLGYYSSDFHNHPISFLLAYLFELHDKSKFELIGFSFGPEKNDEMRKRVSSTFNQFINVNLKNDKEVVQLSRDLNIDIAVDLTGFTTNSRFGIFIERCAPIQVNFLGYPATTGADCIDYIIGDKVIIPKENQKDYSEKIIYLPNSFLVNDSTKKISKKSFTREEFGLPKNSFVFCCFNKYYKITPSIFDIWMRLLKKVEGSVLWLTEDNFEGAKNLQKEANQRGVDSNRLIFARHMPSLADHLARHKCADLFIDTIPFNAITAANDALWAGLPVLTRTGESFSSRVAASLLSSIGLPELITKTEKDYETLAIELATNPEKLKQIKKKLEKNILTKPLFDTKLFTKNIELAYTKIYEKYLKNLPLENIEIK